MMVVKELSTEFEIELSTELRNPFGNLLGLCLDVFRVIKTRRSHAIFPPFVTKHIFRIIISQK